MIRALFRALGNLALLAVSMALLSAVSLLLFGSFLLTWPILRKSPKEKRLQATVQLASAVLTTVQAYASADPPNLDPPNS